MSVVTLDLYPGTGGQYRTEIRVGPGQPWADLVAQSASLYLGEPPAQPSDVRRLTFHPAVADPLGLEPMRATTGLLHAYVYRPTDYEAILARDGQINVRYSDFFVTAGEYAAGTYDVEGLPAPCDSGLRSGPAHRAISLASKRANPLSRQQIGIVAPSGGASWRRAH